MLIEGPPGSGKSSLALALIDRGAALVCDDAILLSARAGALFAAPHPRLVGLLEVRNCGILRFPASDGARVCLLLRLDPAAPRFIDEAGCETIAGIAVPALLLTPDSPVLALRAELALKTYGLP